MLILRMSTISINQFWYFHRYVFSNLLICIFYQKRCLWWSQILFHCAFAVAFLFSLKYKCQFKFNLINYNWGWNTFEWKCLCDVVKLGLVQLDPSCCVHVSLPRSFMLCSCFSASYGCYRNMSLRMSCWVKRVRFHLVQIFLGLPQVIF